MVKIEYCYSDGDLAKALKQASDFVKKVGEDAVYHVISRPDENSQGAWWVDVIYEDEAIDK